MIMTKTTELNLFINLILQKSLYFVNELPLISFKGFFSNKR